MKLSKRLFIINFIIISAFLYQLTGAEQIIKITASSTLKPAKKYGVSKMFDGKLNTAWVEGVKGDGIGESIILEFMYEFVISEININNGLQAGKYFMMNNRVKDLKISSYSSNVRPFTYSLKDATGVLNIKMPSGFRAKKLKLKILSVYKGSKWDDTPISEISIPGFNYGKSKSSSNWAIGEWHYRVERDIEFDYYLTVKKDGKCVMTENRRGRTNKWVSCNWHVKDKNSISLKAVNKYGQSEHMVFKKDGTGEVDGGWVEKID